MIVETEVAQLLNARGVHGGWMEVGGRAPLQLRATLGLPAGQLPLVVYASDGRLQL